MGKTGILTIILAVLLVATGYISYPRDLSAQGGLRDEASLSPVSCSDIKSSLKEFEDHVQTTSLISETGDTMNYLLVGNPDAADAILFIPGTSGLIPDWPVHLFTNTTSSPGLKHPYPESDNSLCSEYLLIFVDYPGVGGSQFGGTLSYENIAKDIAQVLNEVIQNYGVSFDLLHVFGWSLGSLTTLKFADYNPDATPLGTLFLSGTKPGGGSDGNQAGCVTAAFELLETDDSDKLEIVLNRLMFPYQDQQPYDGESDPCTDIDKTNDYLPVGVTLEPCESVDECTTTPCSQEVMCTRALALFTENRATGSKWAGGVPTQVYVGERNLVSSYDNCTTFSDDAGATCESAPSDDTPEDGSMCKCLQSAANEAQCFSTTAESGLGCAVLSSAQGLVVFNGKEDIFIQWLFGGFLVDGYNAIRDGFATLINYDEDQGIQAGHALPMQAPAWMQDKIYDQIESLRSSNGYPVPTINAWGVMAMAVLGIFGFLALRRRSMSS